ncbi:hypothetical protein PLICRDRAFT_175716 [Plicaturopsis crispa FD-325 SS-3]|nr:hypothetical protein PLICRDRAFT_175716 [Plicaturopsis crispa FD-325 SS-3]
MKASVAVEGCCHGELDAIYSHIAQLETRNQYKVDLLLICGDFQAIRNHQDLQCMAVPQKYKQLGGFHKYYTGQTKAPILTIVIGGNHEASNYMWELYHGGWLAPNIYFLGHAGCVQVNGVRIAGASGIFKPGDFSNGNWEALPYDNKAMRSIYHVREYNIRRLSLLSSPNIFLSHDWPAGIEHYGDTADLLRRKPFFRADVQNGQLGSPALMGLIHTLRPEWWFAAHLHVRFEATYNGGSPADAQEGAVQEGQGENPDEIRIDDDDDEGAKDANPDEIVMSDEEEDVSKPAPEPPRTTKFLALDKCLPRRQFLEVIDAPTTVPSSPPMLTFDPEWLAIARAFHPLLSTTRHQPPFPPEDAAREMVARARQWVDAHVPAESLRVDVCQEFVMTAPGPGSENRNQQPPWYTNPQTVAFCKMLGVENKINPPPPGVAVPLRADAVPPPTKDAAPGPSME